MTDAIDYKSKEYQTYLREERARRKAGLAARAFVPEPVIHIQDSPTPKPENHEDLHRFTQYNYRDSGGAG